MKRKKIIIVSIGCILAVALYLVCYMNENTIKVRKEWKLSNKEISKLEIKGLSQNLNVVIKESDGQENCVIMEGNIPESFAKKIEGLKPQEDSLSINFATSSGVSIAKNVKDSLEVTICVEDIELFNNLTVKANKGNVNVTVPKGFQSKYQLSTNYGEIKAPEESMDTDNEVEIELGSGNITIADK